MPEILLACVLMLPQIVAGIYAKSMGKNFWFWFFISFLLPIISLLILLYLDRDKSSIKQGYQLADHVQTKEKKRY